MFPFRCIFPSRVALAILLLLCGAAMAQRMAARRLAMPVGSFAQPGSPTDTKLHITQGSPAGFPWILTGPGAVGWQINTNGSLSTDALKTAMQLEVNGSSFPGPGAAVLNTEGTEIELAPASFATAAGPNAIRVSRRVLVNKDRGYARWIDMIQATGGQAVTVNLRYLTYLPNPDAALAARRGATEKDGWLCLSGDSDAKSFAALVFTTGEAQTLRPATESSPSGDSVSCRLTLSVSPDKSVALCFFVVQQDSGEKLRQMMQEFDPRRELAGLSPELRKMILNMPPPLALPGMELDRNYDADTLKLRSGDELRGQIKNESFEIKTAFGTVKVPSAHVVGLAALSAEQDTVKLGTTDGQVLLGDLAGPLAIKLSGGSELSVPARKLQQACYQVSIARPASPVLSKPLVMLQRGECLAFDPAGMKLDFLTSSGKLSLEASQVQSLETSVPQGVHRLVLKNGSTLSGLLAQDGFKLKLALSAEVSLKAWQVRQIKFAAAPQIDERLCRVLLENGDVLYGQFVGDWKIRGDAGEVDVKPGDIATAEVAEGSLALQAQLKNGTRLGGRLGQEYVTIRLEGGPEMQLFAGKIRGITGPQADAAPSTAPPAAKRSPAE